MPNSSGRRNESNWAGETHEHLALEPSDGLGDLPRVGFGYDDHPLADGGPPNPLESKAVKRKRITRSGQGFTLAEKREEAEPDALTSLGAVDARPLPLDALHARADKLTQAVRPKQNRVARLDRARVDDSVDDRPDERHAEHVRDRVLERRVDLVLDRSFRTAVQSRRGQEVEE